ncbi:MAG: glycine dehydrogenase, partial [Lysobacteraceae bacterium]
MPFIPHTESDVTCMLAAIGVDSIEDLFDEIPEALKVHALAGVPAGLSEMETNRLLRERAAMDAIDLNFAGAGAYEHHIPSAVWQIVGRGEFYSAYTPYQAEASQGTLQLIYEFQTMMTRLTGMDISNASMYDGATSLAEAVLMAERCRKKGVQRVLIPTSVHPAYRKTVRTIVASQDIEVVELPCQNGFLDPASLDAVEGEFSALVIPQPNFFGVLEEVDALTDWAHARGM